MSSIIANCPTCGSVLDPGYGAGCPQCSAASSSITQPQPRLWGTGTALLVWMASFILTIGVPLVFGLLYLVAKIAQTRQPPTEEALSQDVTLALISLGTILPAHLLILLICWLVVTSGGKRPFLQTISWGRLTPLDWVYAITLAGLMMVAGYVFQKLLPHRETSFEKLLNLSYSVRVMAAALAVLTAPLVEEVVYRGVLYAGIERDWGKTAGVVVVTFLFFAVHVYQYRESYAALSAIVTLSLALTLLRALTGKLAPCVVTHLVYNGIQAAWLLFAPESAADSQ
ncbi:MAG TPA: CPBP family intramembrane glutamic endopeptidase [Blastocatellia bacterium]|nr:CPBP family intramembrane glutamic endopeptidase [Blastocatellia bacterium]